MSKSENIKAFEAALKESKELQEKFETAKKRIAENKDAASDSEMLVKAAAEVGYTISVAEVERAFAQNQELSDEELDKVAGGCIYCMCWMDYGCFLLYKTSRLPSNEEATPSTTEMKAREL